MEKGIRLMEDDFEKGRKLMLMDLSELPDDAYVGTPYGCGAPMPEGTPEAEKFRELPHLSDSAALLAFQRLEAYIGKKFTAVSTTELGGENTAEALHAACLLGLPVMDADPAGRSVPELQHSTYYIKDIPIYPAAVATNFGESIILENACNDFRAEDMIRALAVASGNEVGVADHPMTGGVYRESVIPNALSMAENIGRIVREKRNEGGKAVAREIAKKHNGKFLFCGKLIEAPWELAGGFNVGYLELEGTEEFSGQNYRIYFKNETMIAYRNGQAEIMVPDLICMIDGAGEPFTIPNFKVGMEMNIIGLPAHPLWTSKTGLSIFGPRAMGYDLDYSPFSMVASGAPTVV